MPDKGIVDFLIIGVQKAGTTSLFRYLSAHPNIYMPSLKETEFFSNDNKFSKGPLWYQKEYFAKAHSSSVKGEASTHYMMFGHVPLRIYNVVPNVKLIALLRNPIDRAYSHYQMAVRRGVETRPFDDIVCKAVVEVGNSDNSIDHNTSYLLFGEYGRILCNYYNLFDAEQIKVVFSEEMFREPATFMQAMYRHLGVKDDFVPEILGRPYHKSGRQRIPGLNKWVSNRVRWLKRQRWASRFIWRIDFDSLLFWLETQLNVKPIKAPVLSEETRLLLANYYWNDVILLKQLIGREVPWVEFNSATHHKTPFITMP